jgi:hypothetical protein
MYVYQNTNMSNTATFSFNAITNIVNSNDTKMVYVVVNSTLVYLMNFTAPMDGTVVSFNTSAVAAFDAALPKQGRNSIGITDFVLINNTYGMMVTSNYSLLAFSISSTT